jgi:hypothetical protein
VKVNVVESPMHTRVEVRGATGSLAKVLVDLDLGKRFSGRNVDMDACVGNSGIVSIMVAMQGTTCVCKANQRFMKFEIKRKTRTLVSNMISVLQKCIICSFS